MFTCGVVSELLSHTGSIATKNIKRLGIG